MLAGFLTEKDHEAALAKARAFMPGDNETPTSLPEGATLSATFSVRITEDIHQRALAAARKVGTTEVVNDQSTVETLKTNRDARNTVRRA